MLRQFINSSIETTFDLSDVLIAHIGTSESCEATYTFDKKASKFKLFEKV